jgi:hypothetical protein
MDEARIKGRLPPLLHRCPSCSRHVFKDTSACPHCGADIGAVLARRLEALRLFNASAAAFDKLLRKVQRPKG